MHTYKYEIHVLAVYCRGKKRKGLCTVGTGLCKLEKETLELFAVCFVKF